MLDADTVNTVAKNVKPKSDETKVRRLVIRRALDMGILKLFYFSTRNEGRKKSYMKFAHVHHAELLCES
jgi:hypothetical protein